MVPVHIMSSRWDWNLFGVRQARKAVTRKDKMKISIATLPKFLLRETKNEEITLSTFFLPLPVFMLIMGTSQQTKEANMNMQLCRIWCQYDKRHHRNIVKLKAIRSSCMEFLNVLWSSILQILVSITFAMYHAHKKRNGNSWRFCKEALSYRHNIKV